MLYTSSSAYGSSDQIKENVSEIPPYFAPNNYSAPLVNQSTDFCVSTNAMDCGSTFNNNVVLMNNNYFPATTSTNYNNYNNWSNLSTNRLISVTPPDLNFNVVRITKSVDSNFENKENSPPNNFNENRKEVFSNNVYSTITIPITENATVLKNNFNNSLNKSTSSRKEFNSNIEELRYRERRQKNNEAAKQSRSKRRDRENYLKEKVDTLEAENKLLKEELDQLRLKFLKNENDN